MTRDQQIVDGTSPDQMLLDDALERRGIALAVPATLGVHDRNRPALANPQAIGLAAENAALLRQPELLQPLFQERPGREPALLLTALRRGLIAAEKDVAPRCAHADRVGDALLRSANDGPHFLCAGRVRRRKRPDPI